MNIEKMREEFEREWNKVSGRTPERSIAMDGQNSYENRVDDAAWWAWQASRESLVIELPSECGVNVGKSWSTAFNSARLQCLKAIEAAGLKVKS